MPASAGEQAQDPRFAPAYSFSEAAICLRMPVVTLRIWALGRNYAAASGQKRTPAMFRVADRKNRLLSFINLIEAHVLRGLRTKLDFTIHHVRVALREVGKRSSHPRPLAFEDFLTDGADLLVHGFGGLIKLNSARWLAFQGHLERIDREGINGPIRFFPFSRSEIAGSRITTAEIAARVRAGEAGDQVAKDFDLTPRQIEDAVLFERNAVGSC